MILPLKYGLKRVYACVLYTGMFCGSAWCCRCLCRGCFQGHTFSPASSWGLHRSDRGLQEPHQHWGHLHSPWWFWDSALLIPAACTAHNLLPALHHTVPGMSTLHTPWLPEDTAHSDLAVAVSWCPAKASEDDVEYDFCS